MRPIQEFMAAEASSGVVLLACTLAALAWANSPWGESYTRLLHTEIAVHIGGFVLSESLLHWINDGLMAVFFFVVGLEIKREVLVGELASPRQAALPLAAALGGMIVPAVLYLMVNAGGPGSRGWGIPMATDIAFSLGVLALLGSRAPASLKVFLTALAIADDIGAVLVIALFYSGTLAWTSLAAAGVVLALLLAANALGARRPLVYLLLGGALWYAVFTSGVHATIAGVLLAFTIPARTRIDAEEFVRRGREALDQFRAVQRDGASTLSNHQQQAAAQTIEMAADEVQTPLQRIEHALHPWVAFAIMPLFALANAGVTLGEAPEGLVGPVTFGVVLGLVLGKTAGITLASWLAVRVGLAQRPASMTWTHIVGVAAIGGIGFTMSLFIATLAFGENGLLAQAKVGILAASVLAGLLGATILSRAPRMVAPRADAAVEAGTLR